MSRLIATAVDRRQFLAHAAAATAAVSLPAGGEACERDVIRVGLVGCGGRGTGAAAQALAADPGARLVAMGDLFTDQIGSSHAWLAALHGPQVDCPAPRRFVGVDACRRVLDVGVDVVVLAAAPNELSAHLLAAIRAGVHAYCEAPVAVDLAGLHAAATAVELAHATGRSIAAGLCYRHDPQTQAHIAAIHAGRIGDVRAALVEARIGLPWSRPVAGRDDAAAVRARNWVSCADLSGGPFVAHHVHAIDKALWAFGDAAPVAVEARVIDGPRGMEGGRLDGVAARYLFADGRTINAACHRRSDHPDRIMETVSGSAGVVDLRDDASAGSGVRFQAAMTRFMHAVRSGRTVDEGGRLHRATLAAVLGRLAAETGRRIEWAAVAAAPTAASLQSARA